MAWIQTTEALTKLNELLFRSKYLYNFDGIPLVAERLSFRKKINLLLAGLDMFFPSKYSFSLPPVIHIEPTNICNLKCPLCPTGSRTLKRQKGIMSLKTFQTILDEAGDTLISVYFFSFGEPFLNKDLPNMIAACTKQNILSLISTNGHFLQTLEEATAVVSAGLNILIIAIDGSNQKIYQKYRKNGDIEKVKRCAALIEEAKVKNGSQFPYTVLRTVVTKDNEKDLSNIERLARQLRVNMFSTKSLGCLVQDEKFTNFEPEEKRLRRFENKDRQQARSQHFRCPFPFRQPVFMWDGTLVGCEYDHEKEFSFGIIEKKGYKKSWNSANAKNLRTRILKGDNLPAFCQELCPYRYRTQDSVNIFCKELRPLKSLG